MKKIRALLVPVFDRGQAAVILILITVLGLISIFNDPRLALYVGLGAYIGIVMRAFLFGLAPDEIEIQEHEVAPISTMLNAGRLIEQVGDGVWAPSRYKSSLWRSSRISIAPNERGNYWLRARQRDLKSILKKLRERGLR